MSHGLCPREAPGTGERQEHKQIVAMWGEQRWRRREAHCPCEQLWLLQEEEALTGCWWRGGAFRKGLSGALELVFNWVVIQIFKLISK